MLSGVGCFTGVVKENPVSGTVMAETEEMAGLEVAVELFKLCEEKAGAP